MNDDLISRKAVLKQIRKIECEPGYQHEGEDWAVGLMIADIIVESAESIELIPSTEPERKWIPVIERLPEEEKDVLVSVHFDGYKDEYINYPPSDYVEIASHIDGVWSSIYDDFKMMRRLHHIVAWAKLPEPYGGEYEN